MGIIKKKNSNALTWQCVKTNSTPSVHIKIAGFMDVHSPKNGIFIDIDP